MKFVLGRRLPSCQQFAEERICRSWRNLVATGPTSEVQKSISGFYCDAIRPMPIDRLIGSFDRRLTKFPKGNGSTHSPSPHRRSKPSDEATLYGVFLGVGCKLAKIGRASVILRVRRMSKPASRSAASRARAHPRSDPHLALTYGGALSHFANLCREC